MTVEKPRAPSPARRYITPEGLAALQQELDQLWRIKRPQVTLAVSEAAALGDRSENAEYIYGKKQLREIDRRVRYLRKRLDEVLVVDQVPADPNRVYFGAWVGLESEQGEGCCYRLVGSDEIDPQKGYISLDSPLARALLRKTLDDEVRVQTPHGEQCYWITSIAYRDPVFS